MFCQGRYRSKSCVRMRNAEGAEGEAMRRGKKQFAVLLGIVLVFGGLAAGCAGGAGTQGGQPTEPSTTSGTGGIDNTPGGGNTVQLPPTTNTSTSTSANTQTSTETCDGDPKPAIPGKPDPNDNSVAMQWALNYASPNSITNRASLSFIAVCFPGGTPPWDLRITDGVNQSPSLSWEGWSSDTGNTTYGQNS